MSDTPRTDSSELPHALDDHHFVVGSFFARQLERELNAANTKIKRLEEMYEGVIGERPELLGSNVMGLLKRELNAANERIKRLEEAHSWRLIETAPSNYTWILGYDEEHGETGMIIFERGDESEPHWTDGMREWEPTHWMPLPEPPKSKEAKL